MFFFSSLLSNPEVLRQLQTLQQTLSQSGPEIDLEKLRKLQEMKQQEEEFDKHLAQTVPVSFNLFFFFPVFLSFHFRLIIRLFS